MASSRTHSFDDRLPGIRLRILGSDRGGVAAEQVGLFLFDFTVAFELFRRIVETEGTVRLTQWDLYRGHRRVSPIERLAVERLRMESPIEIVATTITLTTAGVGAVWATIQAIERIYMLPLIRKKAELELRKLEHEVRRIESGEEGAATRKLPARSHEGDTPRLPAQLRDESARHRAREPRFAVATVLDDLVRRPDEERRSESDSNAETRRVVETVQRRLLRNPIQVEQLELEFDRNLPPPAG